jgi:hypothetical protein
VRALKSGAFGTNKKTSILTAATLSEKNARVLTVRRNYKSKVKAKAIAKSESLATTIRYDR